MFFKFLLMKTDCKGEGDFHQKSDIPSKIKKNSFFQFFHFSSWPMTFNALLLNVYFLLVSRVCDPISTMFQNSHPQDVFVVSNLGIS